MVQVFARADVELKQVDISRMLLVIGLKAIFSYYIKQISLMGQRLLCLIQMDK